MLHVPIGDMWPNSNEAEEPSWVKTEREQFGEFRDKNKDGHMDREEVREWIIPPDYDHAEAEAKHLIYESDGDRVGRAGVMMSYHMTCHVIGHMAMHGVTVQKLSLSAVGGVNAVVGSACVPSFHFWDLFFWKGPTFHVHVILKIKFDFACKNIYVAYLATVGQKYICSVLWKQSPQLFLPCLSILVMYYIFL